MGSFAFQTTKIDGLQLITPPFSRDHRGCFTKTFETGVFSANGIRFNLYEELETSSGRSTLRGLHFQRHHSQDKLVRVLSGEIYDVAVDLRPGSKTFGKWQGFRLSAENRQMFYIPKGFAHGFLALCENTALHYLCGDRYDPESEDGIIWNDPELGIQWPLEQGETPQLSDRDKGFQTFAQFKRALTLEIGGN